MIWNNCQTFSEYKVTESDIGDFCAAFVKPAKRKYFKGLPENSDIAQEELPDH